MYVDDLPPHEILSPLTRELCESTAREQDIPLTQAFAEHLAAQEEGARSPGHWDRISRPRQSPRAYWDVRLEIEALQAAHRRKNRHR